MRPDISPAPLPCAQGRALGSAAGNPRPSSNAGVGKRPPRSPCIPCVWRTEKAVQPGRWCPCSHVLRSGKLPPQARTHGNMAVGAETAPLRMPHRWACRIEKQTQLHQPGSAVRATAMVGVQTSSLRGFGRSTL